MLAPFGCPIQSPCPLVPETLPLPVTLEYRKELENWIKCYFANSVFNICLHQRLQTMTGEPLSISFLDNCQPVAVHKSISVPHHSKETVKSQLDADVALKIFEPVSAGTLTTWYFKMITVPKKKDGSPRRTVYLQNLKVVTRRETHHTPSPFNLVSTVPLGKKTVLDA